MLSAYHRVLTGGNEIKRMAAAKAWSVWEGRTATLLPDHEGSAPAAVSRSTVRRCSVATKQLPSRIFRR